MYSKYEEMCVIRDIINGYISSQKQSYDNYTQQLKVLTQQRSLGIDDIDGQKELFQTVGLMQSFLTDYNKGVEVARELQKANNCYEQAYTQDNIQSGLDDERGKEGNRIFFDLRTKNADYTSIMSEIAMEAWRKDENMSNLGLDLDSQIARLEQSFNNGNITKQQFIYYTNMSSILINTHQYVEYMQQFSQNGVNQGKVVE